MIQLPLISIHNVRRHVLMLLFIIFKLQQTFCQCTPPLAEICEESAIFCSLDELNGYACNNSSTIASPCQPLCSQGGVGNNTSWWGFTTQGGHVSVTISVGTCSINEGVQYGIWGDCNCGEEIICRSDPIILPNTMSTFSANLQPCKTYFLWIDGSSGDVCDFTIATSGGMQPTLSPLPFINNMPNSIIEPVSAGSKNVPFFINKQPGNCEPNYVWTLDNDEVGGNTNEIKLDFPDEGDFELCVTAYIGNLQNGSICSQEGPRCATVKVRLNDSLELVKFYNNFDGNNWTNNTNWLTPGKRINEWAGIKADSSGRVLEIYLAANGLVGKLYNFNFPYLTKLELNSNDIFDSLIDFNNLNSLAVINLSNNNLTGSIPNFKDLHNLELLNFSSNSLTNSIPNLYALTKLIELNLENNNLSGRIPDFLNKPDLLNLLLSNNLLSDNIPYFSNLPQLSILSLGNNLLTGPIPNFINLSDLTFLVLSNNLLSGSIPNFFNNFNNFQELDLSNNFLSGSIPDSIIFLRFSIDNNLYTFSDIIPIQAAPLRLIAPQKAFYIDTLIYVKKAKNLIIDLLIDSLLSDNLYTWTKNISSWTVPHPNLPNSNKLILDSIKLADYGRYNVSVTNPRALDLTLHSNTISIRICDVEHDSLELIKLYDSLNGHNWTNRNNWLQPNAPIKSWYGISTDSFGCVRNIKLVNNNLTGTLPILNLNTLDTLILSQNKIVGPIPELGIPFIKTLDLSYNQLTDPTPNNFGEWMNTRYLDLSNNKFATIPPDYPDLCELEYSNFSGNQITGSLDDYSGLMNLYYMNFSNNNLSGIIPDFQFIPNLQYLYLNGNQLSGNIPDFSNIPKLNRFTFHDNLFSDLVPHFSNLPNLKFTELHNNYYTFSDIIPVLSDTSAAKYIYSPQHDFYNDTTFIVKLNDSLTINLLIDNFLADNNYHWKKDSVSLMLTPPNDSSINKLIFSSIQAEDYGRYQVSVTNPQAQDLTLFSKAISLKVCDLFQDSIELVKLFDSTNGPNWTNHLNWKVQGSPISSWHGVGNDSLGCVRSIKLANNNLSGTLPEFKFNTLDSLLLNSNNLSGVIPELKIPFIKYLDLSNNQFTGALPNTIQKWKNLNVLKLGSNLLTNGVPKKLSSLFDLTELRLNNNIFTGELPEELTSLQKLEIGKVNFSNNQIDSLKDKIIFFCPFGHDILENNPSYNRFLNICNLNCTGTEWEHLSNFPWIPDTLMSLDCKDSLCFKTITQAGFVNVRDIKAVFIRTRCFKDSLLNDFDEIIKFYNCGGNLIEMAICLFHATCVSLGAITADQLDTLNYEVKWNCGDSIQIITNISDPDHEDSNKINVYNWRTLDCHPNPVIDLLSCEGFEKDNLTDLQVFDLNGKLQKIPFTVHGRKIEIDVQSLNQGVYIVNMKGENGMYRTKIVVIY